MNEPPAPAALALPPGGTNCSDGQRSSSSREAAVTWIPLALCLTRTRSRSHHQRLREPQRCQGCCTAQAHLLMKSGQSCSQSSVRACRGHVKNVAWQRGEPHGATCRLLLALWMGTTRAPYITTRCQLQGPCRQRCLMALLIYEGAQRKPPSGFIHHPPIVQIHMGTKASKLHKLGVALPMSHGERKQHPSVVPSTEPFIW